MINIVKPEIQGRVREMQLSHVRKILKKLVQAGKDTDVISFGGGTPFLKPPELFSQKINSVFSEFKSHTYGVTAGLGELRELIALELQGEGFKDARAENVLVTSSSTNGLDAAMETLLGKGDELVIASPYFVNFTGQFKLRELKVKKVETSVEEGYRLGSEALKEAITKKTKGILAVSPDNPTGRVLSAEEVKTMGDLAVDNGAVVFADEAYYKVLFAKKHYKFTDYLDNVVGLRSYSKTTSMPGWRLGYNYASKEVVEQMEKVNSVKVVCPNMLGQRLLVEYYKDETARREYDALILREYSKRREAMSSALKEYLPEAKVVEPEGGFYFFLKLPGKIQDDEAFSDKAFSEQKVAVVPGSAFGVGKGEGYFRFSFVSESPERIREGVKRIGNLL